LQWIWENINNGGSLFSLNTKILVVDDMNTMRVFIRKNLHQLGFKNLVEAENGEKAWGELHAAYEKKSPFEVVISDWTMPKLKGIQLLQRVRAHENFKHLPFIMLTAENEASAVREAIAAGVTDYIVKPFTLEILQDKLEAAHQTVTKKAA